MKWKLKTIGAWLLALLFVGMVLLPIVSLVSAQESEPGVVRTLPSEADCGSTFTVTLVVDPVDGTTAWIIEESPPQGVTIDSNAYNEDNHLVKWVSIDGNAATHTYDVILGEDLADGTVLTFSGGYRFDPSMDEQAEITGDTQVTVSCPEDETETQTETESETESENETESEEETESESEEETTSEPAPDASGDSDAGVERSLPDQAVQCGVPFTVSLAVNPLQETSAWFLDDAPGAGTQVGEVTGPNGEFVEDQHRVKWLQLSGSGTTVTYDVTVVAGTPDGATLSFDGEFRFHPGMDARAPVTGDSEVEVSCPASGTVTRSLPTTASPNQTVQVEIAVGPPEGTSDWFVDEILPDALNATDVDDVNLGAYVPSTNRVKWLSLDGESATHTYNITVPADAAPQSVIQFNGEFRFHPVMDFRAAVTGDDRICVVACPSTGGSGGSGSGDGGSGGGGGSNGGGGGNGGDNGDNGENGGEENGPGVIEVDAETGVTPEGALNLFYTRPVTGESGDTVEVNFADADIPSMEIVLGHDINGIEIQMIKWPGDNAPPGTSTEVPGTQVAFYLEVRGIGAGHVATFELALDPSDVPDLLPEDRSVILHDTGGSWELITTSDLGLSEGRMRGEATVNCCSFFGVAFDLDPPILSSLDVDVDRANETVSIKAEVIENLAVERIEFYINDELWQTLRDAPYEIELDIDEEFQVGQHEVAVRAFDQSGFSDEEVQGFEVQEEVSTKEPKVWVWVFVVIGVAAVAGGGFYLVSSGQGSRIVSSLKSGKK